MEKIGIPKIEKKEDIPFAPEGWKINQTLAKDLHFDKTNLSLMAKKYFEDHPEYFKDFRNKKGRVFQHYAPELVTLLKEQVIEAKKVSYAPAGWMTNTMFAKKVGIDRETIKTIVGECKEEYIGQIKPYKTKEGPVREHYSPDFLKILEEKTFEFRNTPEAPEGWVTAGKIASKINSQIREIKNIAETYRKDYKNYFRKYKVKGGPVREHYSPFLVSYIEKAIKDFQETPEPFDGWETAGNLAKKLNMAHSMVTRIANQYRNDHSDYFKNCKPRKGKIHEYYSPELVAIIENENKKRIPAPDGWKTTKKLSDILGTAEKTIFDIASKYRDRPDFFGKFVPGSGALCEHFSPELVQIIIDEVQKFPHAPEGWMTASSIASLFGSFNKNIKKLADPYHITNPEYFLFYKDSVGKVREHYAPRLVEIIQKKLEEKNKHIPEAPENWLLKKNISEKTGLSSEELDTIIRKYRKEKPEDIGKFKDRKNI